MLGGGGYTIRNVARCWAHETGIILNKPLDETIPYNEYYEYYGPDYTLAVSPSNMVWVLRCVVRTVGRCVGRYVCCWCVYRCRLGVVVLLLWICQCVVRVFIGIFVNVFVVCFSVVVYVLLCGYSSVCYTHLHTPARTHI